MMLEGKVALVTGGGQGIGEGICEVFAREGAKVVVVTRRESTCRPVAERIAEAGGEARWFAADVSKPEDVKAMVDFAVAEFGRLDVAVNNAGKLGPQAALADIDIAELDDVLALDLRGTYLCCQEEIKVMRSQGAGSIVNVSSISALHGDRMLSPYNTAKHAVNGFTRAAALEEIGNGIRINAICPGAIMTPLQVDFKEKDPEGFAETLAKSNIPIGRMGEPDEIGNVVAFLASDLASYIVGATIVADGGVTAQ